MVKDTEILVMLVTDGSLYTMLPPAGKITKYSKLLD